MKEMTRREQAFRFGTIVIVFGLLTPNAKALDLFSDPLPQAQSNTCQSYAVMLALAAQGDPSFPMNTFAQLRNAEGNFRKIAEGIPGGPYSHDALKAAVTQYTGGKYGLKIEARNGIVEWMSRVRALTTLRSSSDVLIAQLTGTNFPVVLTSVTKFEGSAYADGHVLTVLGVAGSGLNSDTELVAFNSAIKGGVTINRCEPGTQPGDLRYSAGVVSTNNYTLKTFPDGYRILYLSKN
jgi:hypothetical protein